jgi:hypothetical protein
MALGTSAGLLAGQLPSAVATAPLPSLGDFEIWDLHCHLATVAGVTPKQRADRLVEIANRMGIDRLIFFMGFPWSYDPDPKEFRRQNDQVMRIVEYGQPRLLGFAYLNPAFAEESLAEFARCVRHGSLVGIKLWVSKRCHEKEIDPIIREADKLKAAIYQHTWFNADGNRPDESTPDDLAQLAERHPSVPLICGHAGGDWELGIRAIRKHKNISIELGGFDPTSGVVEMAVRELGPERILYGSDVAGRSFASQLGKVLGAEISDDIKRQILAGNLKNMLRPILQSKGLLE